MLRRMVTPLRCSGNGIKTCAYRLNSTSSEVTEVEPLPTIVKMKSGGFAIHHPVRKYVINSDASKPKPNLAKPSPEASRSI
ncbi:hypothetical protein SARC_11694 [Sphaeroforma arctica JP610]|uniref:Uncharacterized protein n=1 Tax=Sphaeroforma arctica JP610 TaxID=667725 RepID=A0A0L0FG96_9EUKA|nr:hypothetical protein SARC_11694 [Sphaeroforma arctica JP610]KNC75785.1 hypothetical protein SARC_11694 [Sphaeroforma arctica JP610]|eukprot:XP_014149687.1 hypothetical protein SARC_11694 [Sphaeroforma arctica JP610]